VRLSGAVRQGPRSAAAGGGAGSARVDALRARRAWLREALVPEKRPIGYRLSVGTVAGGRCTSNSRDTPRAPPARLERVSKRSAYADLVHARRACRLCPGLANPSVVADGQFDSDEIGPYARWQGNLDSGVVVVAQDFAEAGTFQALVGWPGEHVETNLALVNLLAEAGLAASPPKRGQADDALFFTNAALCLKAGRMSSRVPARYFLNCGEAFLRPTIELVALAAVVTLGAGALRSVEAAFAINAEPLIARVERSPPSSSARASPFSPCTTRAGPSRTRSDRWSGSGPTVDAWEGGWRAPLVGWRII
jgi:uracil-DNA glycosylase